MRKCILKRGLLISLLALLLFNFKVLAGEPVVHIMVCCKFCNRGTDFLVNGQWNANHDYADINQTRDILQKIKDAGISIVSIDMTNSAQWERLWSSSLTQINNIQQVCREKNMQFYIFIGGQLTQEDKDMYNVNDATTYWNQKAGIILNIWAGDPTYRKYGYGDNRPILNVFLPGQTYWPVYDSAPEKNNLAQFRIGTTQVNDPITPQSSDGWGYRNMSGNPEGTVRFVSTNGGVSPDQFHKVSPQEWSNRIDWARQATQYSVYGSYDDTCDGIQWGISRTANSTAPYNIYPGNGSNPRVYYDIIKNKLNPPSTTQTPYAGVIGIPGTIEAENYDKGGEGVAYHDTEASNLGGVYRTAEGVDIQSCTEGGYNIGWSNAGEWLEYSVNVASAGSYQLQVRVATPNNAGSLHVEMNGSNVTGSIAVPNTAGWQSWQTVSKTVNLSAGQQVMRVVIEQGGFNLNKLTFTSQAGNTGIVSGQVYRLVSRKSGKVLDVSGCGTQNGSNVQQWPWLGGNCQRWKVSAVADGYYILTAQNSGRALDVDACNPDDGTNVQVWDNWGGECQQWKIIPTTNGYYKVIARSGGKALDVASCSTADSANVQIWTYGGDGECQQWKFEKVAATASSIVSEVSSATAKDELIEVTHEKGINLFPNPSNDKVTVRWNNMEAKETTITVVNVNGKVLLRKSVNNERQQELEISGLKPGVYIVVLKNKMTVMKKKIIIY